MSMRIACVHVPQFALQCQTRVDPALRGAPVAVIGSGIDPAAPPWARERLALASPVVHACSRAAWVLGVRIGMTAPAARALSADLQVVAVDPELERETVRALADVLLAIAPVVDLGGRVGPGGGHLAMYCEVPSKARGAAFGGKLIARLAALGLTARVGIADDRFTAWVAAIAGTQAPRGLPGVTVHGEPDDTGVVSVPRGGSAAFLAPRPLSLLAITPEVQHMLEALGVTTLGEFAALPAPSVARPFEADYQALARGDSGQALRPYAPEAPIHEAVALRSAAVLSVPAAVALLAERLALRLVGRQRGAVRLDLVIGGDRGERVVSFAPPRGALASAEELAEALGSALGDGRGEVWRIQVIVAAEALVGAASAAAPASAVAGARAGAGTSAGAGAGARPAAVVGATVDALSVALASPPIGALGAAAGRAEPRDGHRRTKRSRQRRRSERSEALLQPRLFKNLP